MPGVPTTCIDSGMCSADENPVGMAHAGAPLGRVIALTAEAPLSDHAVLRRTLWLRLTGDPSRPVMVHRAEQGLAPRAAPETPCLEAPP